MFIFLLQIFLIQGLKFNFTIEKRTLRCFGDNLPQNMMVIGMISAPLPNYTFKIKIPGRKESEGLIFNSSDLNLTRFAFSTQENANFQFCVSNQHNREMDFEFEYKTGADALDFTVIARREDFELMENQAVKMKDLLATIKKEHQILQDREEQRNTSLEQIQWKIMLFSGITMVLLVIATLYQVGHIKRFVKVKKLT